MTVWWVLSKHQVKLIVRRRMKAGYIRYNKDIPDERVQLDVTKLGDTAYQFTPIDDCTRMKVIKIYPNKKLKVLSIFWERFLIHYNSSFNTYKPTAEQSSSMMFFKRNCMSISSNSDR